jgi:hypothetical protein
VDTAQVEPLERREQGLDAEETHLRIHPAQVVDT